MNIDSASDQNDAIRNAIESVISGNSRSLPTENVAQLLAAAIAQAGHANIDIKVSVQDKQSNTYQDQGEQRSFDVNSLVPENPDQLDQPNDISPLNKHRRTLSVKLPIEVRKRIIAMRKDGKLCQEIAKELKASTSGVRKVWERFLATGMVHDLKPNSGRPRKYTSPLDFELQYANEGVVPKDVSPHNDIIEYVTLSEPANDETATSADVHLAEEGEMFVEGPMDAPGATVEIVETDLRPSFIPLGKPRRPPQINREELLLKLIKGCPLSVVREDATEANSPHVMNVSSLSERSLFMERTLGYPFGAAPSPKPFVFDSAEAQVILSDPLNPLGKELLASLGYSTKVYFNMCCVPSPLFDSTKVVTDLPFFIGPGGIAETTQSVVQLLVNLCRDPVSALAHIPSGSGPSVVAESAESGMSSVQLHVGVPVKLSAYWSMLFQFAADLECCENFLSASPPSAPCLLCHPYQELVKNLEIREPQGDEIWSPTPKASRHSHELTAIESMSPSNELPIDMPKRGRPGKTDTSENELLVDGQFEVPASIKPSSVVIPDKPLLSSTVALTTDSSAVPSLLPVRELTVLPVTGEQDKTPLRQPKTTSDATHSSTLRRSLRKRGHTPRASVADKPMTQPQKSSSLLPGTDVSLTECRRSKRLSSPEQQQQCRRGVVDWSIDDVVEFVASIPRCKCASVFKEHEVDGESLLSLDAEMMVKLMGIKSGPALKICRRLQALNDDIDS